MIGHGFSGIFKEQYWVWYSHGKVIEFCCDIFGNPVYEAMKTCIKPYHVHIASLFAYFFLESYQFVTGRGAICLWWAVVNVFWYPLCILFGIQVVHPNILCTSGRIFVLGLSPPRHPRWKRNLVAKVHAKYVKWWGVQKKKYENFAFIRWRLQSKLTVCTWLK